MNEIESKRFTALGAVPGYRYRRAVLRGLTRLRELLTALAYAVLGVAGLLLWLLAQMPMSARWKENLVYAMAGCLGLFALGWQLLRPRAC